MILVSTVLLGCGGTPPLPEGFGGNIALEAWRSGAELHVKYMGPDGLFYSSSSTEIDLTAQPDEPPGVDLFIVSPQTTERTRWLFDEQTAAKLVILPASEYRKLRERLLSDVVPKNVGEAITIAIGEQRVALFYDDAGRFHSILEEPPGDVRVVRHFSLREYLQAAPEILQSLLDELGLSTREVLFNTGDVGDDALPFLYANVQANLGVLMRTTPFEAQVVAGDQLIAVTQSFSHVTRSHTTGIVTRAFTSLVRLMFMVSYAVKDTFDLAPLLAFETDPPPPLANAPAMDLQQWERDLTDTLGREPETGTIDYLIDGKAFFERFESAIADAQKSIHIRTYIFDNDDYATFIADRLRDRANAGVDVKILIDGLGSLSAHAQPATELPEGYAPPLSIHSYLEAESSVRVRSITNPFFAGDHTKSIIIDEQVAFIGGMNIAREYRYEWHDMMVELRGSVVARLQDDFNVAWAGAGPLGDVARFFALLMPGTEVVSEAGDPIRVLYTRPSASEIRQVQLEAIRRAQQYVYVQNAYLTDDSFLLELVRARRRGVDVRVVVPLESDRGQLTRDNILAANELFRHGVGVYIYPGMSHIKAAIIDGWACLGSANLDQLSLRVNLETNVATSDPAAVEALRTRLFEQDFKVSPRMQEAFPEYWNDRLWEMLGDYVF